MYSKTFSISLSDIFTPFFLYLMVLYLIFTISLLHHYCNDLGSSIDLHLLWDPFLRPWHFRAKIFSSLSSKTISLQRMSRRSVHSLTTRNKMDISRLWWLLYIAEKMKRWETSGELVHLIYIETWSNWAHYMYRNLIFLMHNFHILQIIQLLLDAGADPSLEIKVFKYSLCVPVYV